MFVETSQLSTYSLIKYYNNNDTTTATTESCTGKNAVTNYMSFLTFLVAKFEGNHKF